jgi:hypothetical protein
MIDFTAIPDIDDATMLRALRYGIAQLAISEETTINGRTVRRSQLPQLILAAREFELRVYVAKNGGPPVALAELNDPDIGVDQRNPGNA